MSGTTVHFVDTDDAIVVKTEYEKAQSSLYCARKGVNGGLVELEIGTQYGTEPISIPVERIAYIQGRS